MHGCDVQTPNGFGVSLSYYKKQVLSKILTYWKKGYRGLAPLQKAWILRERHKWPLMSTTIIWELFRLGSNSEIFWVHHGGCCFGSEQKCLPSNVSAAAMVTNFAGIKRDGTSQ